MALLDRMEHLRKEHKKLVSLIDGIEEMLELASKNVFSEHLKGLKGLRSLAHGLSGVEKHCNAKDSTIDSTFLHSLQEEERARIQAEHEQIRRAVNNFREELKYATADRTMALILPGMDLVNRVCAHIAYEREMLARAVPLSNMRRTTTGKNQKRKTALVTQGKHTHKRNIPANAAHIPYTLEPHPEL
jgi:hypothetical protein